MASLPSVRITSKICLLTATLADKDNPLSDALLSNNSSNSQGILVEGRRVCFRQLIGISTLYVRAQSPSLTIKALISSETHMM